VEYLDLIRQLTAPGETDDLSAAEQDAPGVLSWFWQHKGAFSTLRAQQPQTLAHAITGSPAGLLARNAQLFNESLDEDLVPTNTMLYWLTGTAGASIRFSCEDTRAPRPAWPTTIPIALAAAADGDFRPIRRLADRDHAGIASWHVLPGVSSHYAARAHPGIPAADIRPFLTSLPERTRP